MNDFERPWVCLKCGCYIIYPRYIKCNYCGGAIAQLDDESYERVKNFKYAGKYLVEMKVEETYEEIAKKLGNEFDEEAKNKRIGIIHRNSAAIRSGADSLSNNKNVPKCPTCQSTNIKKITATSKATNAVLFGLFGNKRSKQFHCNSCGYEW